jgi:hypothetical protein
MAGERDPIGELGVACVPAEHAREALGALRGALAALIGGRKGVGVVGKIDGEAVDVGHGREALRRDALDLTAEGRGRRHRHHRRPHHPGIDQLARGQPLAVGRAKRRDLAPFDSNDVGGGGADIDQQRLAMTLRRKRGGRMPIG